MRSMGDILIFWRGDTLNMPIHRLRRSRCCSATPTASPRAGEELFRLQFSDNCVIPEITHSAKNAVAPA